MAVPYIAPDPQAALVIQHLEDIFATTPEVLGFEMARLGERDAICVLLAAVPARPIPIQVGAYPILSRQCA